MKTTLVLFCMATLAMSQTELLSYPCTNIPIENRLTSAQQIGYLLIGTGLFCVTANCCKLLYDQAVKKRHSPVVTELKQQNFDLEHTSTSTDLEEDEIDRIQRFNDNLINRNEYLISDIENYGSSDRPVLLSNILVSSIWIAGGMWLARKKIFN